MVPLSSLSTYGVSLLGLTSWLLYLIIGGVYRIYFHPLAKFPGPKVAALTKWYEFYHDIIHKGCFIWKLQQLHDRYGPIVRITPNELHIRDPYYYEEIYASASKKRDKDVAWVVMAGAPTSSFATAPHDLHRLRRSALNQFFSKRSIYQVESLIVDEIDLLAQRFEAAIKTKEVIRLDAAYMALTMDIITHYAYGQSYNYLAEDDFKVSWKETVIGGSANGAFLRQFPWTFPIMKFVPLSVLQVMNPQAGQLIRWQHMVRRQIEGIMEANRKGIKAEGTIFQALLDSDLPKEEKSAARLQDEGQTLVGAGSETTAKSLSIITFYLLQDKKKLQRLREELRNAMPIPNSQPSLTALEQLPYLARRVLFPLKGSEADAPTQTAVINEGLRLMYGVTTRLPRVAPTEALKYKDWVIPPGVSNAHPVDAVDVVGLTLKLQQTPVSESSYFVHMDEAIFPDPEAYDPDRWIKAAKEGVRLDQYLVSFSKGSRMCVGINLAYAELYLTLGMILSRFELESVETTVDDVKLHRDFFVGVPKPESKGIRAQITAKLEGQLAQNMTL